MLRNVYKITCAHQQLNSLLIAVHQTAFFFIPEQIQTLLYIHRYKKLQH